MTAAVLGYVLEERRARLGAFVLFVLLSLVRQHHHRPQSADFRQYQGIAGADADAPAIAEIAAARSLRQVRGAARSGGPCNSA